MRAYLKGILALVSLGSLVSGGWLMAQNAPVKNVVLVHGAFADGSSWSKVRCDHRCSAIQSCRDALPSEGSRKRD
jgi:hypothetical protein